jgi:hypothetical protein
MEASCSSLAGGPSAAATILNSKIAVASLLSARMRYEPGPAESGKATSIWKLPSASVMAMPSARSPLIPSRTSDSSSSSSKSVPSQVMTLPAVAGLGLAVISGLPWAAARPVNARIAATEANSAAASAR